jgi:hypothetical protein
METLEETNRGVVIGLSANITPQLASCAADGQYGSCGSPTEVEEPCRLRAQRWDRAGEAGCDVA